MKLLQITLLLLLSSELRAANINADSHNHAKHKSHAKSSHKSKHHQKKDLDSENDDLLQVLADPKNDPLSDLINASPEDFEKLLTNNQD
jgi:hypothetical protein